MEGRKGGKLLSCVRLLVTPWTVAHQAPPSMGFARQECWSGVPLPSPNSEISQSQRDKYSNLYTILLIWLPLVAQTVKRLSTMRETWVQALGWEDPLEKEMTIHSSTIAWKIPWTEEPGRLQSIGSQRVGHDWATSLHFFCFILFNSLGRSTRQLLLLAPF